MCIDSYFKEIESMYFSNPYNLNLYFYPGVIFKIMMFSQMLGKMQSNWITHTLLVGM